MPVVTTAKITKLRTAKNLARGMPPGQRALWDVMSQVDGEFRWTCEHPFGPWIFDLYCHGARLAVEVDGAAHWEDPKRSEMDRAKDSYARSNDIRVVRIPLWQIYEVPLYLWKDRLLCLSEYGHGIGPGENFWHLPNCARTACRCFRPRREHPPTWEMPDITIRPLDQVDLFILCEAARRLGAETDPQMSCDGIVVNNRSIAIRLIELSGLDMDTEKPPLTTSSFAGTNDELRDAIVLELNKTRGG